MPFTTRLFAFALILLVFACGTPQGDYHTYEATFANGETAEVVVHPVADAQTGMVSAHIPLPAGWKVGPQGWELPGKAMVQEQKGGSFTQGQMPSPDQVLRQQLLPRIQQQGLQVSGMEDLPAVAQNDQRTFAQYWKFAPTQDRHLAKGISYTDAQGKPGYAVVHFIHSQSQFGNMMHYYLHVLQAQPDAYEEAKQAMLHALAHFQIDPQYLAAHNQREQQRAQASNQAHQQRMAANQQPFNAWNQTQQTYSDISDMSMESWRRRNAMNDNGHQQSINGIWEQGTTTNPYTGQQMEMPSGYNHYYTNPNGDYIGTNDHFYQPGMDPNVNNQDWQEVYPDGNGW
ncbi:MAG: hypothetical protein D6722_17025 [Bacteroidetes bacterium]|nr:MAG: hypothetical protein D6722_17025 [Bacteroidota bacterium]